MTLAKAAEKSACAGDHLFVLVLLPPPSAPAARAGAAAGAAAGVLGGIAQLPQLAPVHTESPSRSGGVHLMHQFASVSTALVWPRYTHSKDWSAAAREFLTSTQRLLGRALPAQELASTERTAILVEAPSYPQMEEMHLRWQKLVRRRVLGSTRSATLTDIYGSSFPSCIGPFSISMGFMPQAALRVADVGSCKPAGGTEAKHVDGSIWEGGVYHCYADTRFSFFWGLTFANKIVFHSEPPVGCITYIVGDLAVIYLAELVGQLFLTPISHPMFFASDAWCAAVDALPDQPCGAAPTSTFIVDLDQKVWAFVDLANPPSPQATSAASALGTYGPSARRVFWTVQPYVDAGGQQLFLKVIDWAAYQPNVIREMTQAYAHLQASYGDAAFPLPPSLVPATLHFGDGRLLVRAPYVTGCAPMMDSTLFHPELPQGAADSIADALVWLTMHGIVYTDFRGPNVLLRGLGADAAGSAVATDASAASALTAAPPAVLIDYDDDKHVPGLRKVLLDAATEDADAVNIVAAAMKTSHASFMSSPKVATSFKAKLWQCILLER